MRGPGAYSNRRSRVIRGRPENRGPVAPIRCTRMRKVLSACQLITFPGPDSRRKLQPDSMRPLSILKPPRPFKNLNAPYRMVFINEESLEEVASFQLTKSSLYALFSTIFLITILATVCVLLFTPLKYYIPGYGSNEVRVQAIQLERKVDSLSSLVQAGEEHAQRITALISGKGIQVRDTAMLKPELLKAMPESVLPAPEDIREQAGQTVKQEKRNARKKPRK